MECQDNVKKYPHILQMGMEDAGTNALLGVLKLSDEDAYNHSIGVSKLVALCIEDMNLKHECEWNDTEQIEIVKGSLLHDIGKAFLPFGLQNASVKLDEYTKEIINIHPILGFLVLRDAKHSNIVKNIALLHHTNANGSGYPVNMETKKPYTEDTVPDYVWLVSYADKFDAMVSKRKFKASKSYQEAWNALNNMRINGVLPYKFAKYMNTVVKELSLFGTDGWDEI